ncbi:WD40 repeat-like protein [Exidia glandulosa HHB12029]|uniref:WD40 repeat-like protein n=1 Tax=Exidia glandulosa HHB12029 TaxID=1314781 RepID=A0A165H8G7_EXIGL|nr:WD40 repeat-like protein [Exidia glandulosa HHB12029]
MSSLQYVYNHGTVVNALQCYDDLVAVGGAHTLSVLQVDNTGWVEVASFFLGTPVVALAFSPSTISPTQDKTNWTVQLAVACADGHIRRLTQTASEALPDIALVSDGASTHHGPVTSLAFSGASAGRYLASASLDRTLLVWDLESLPAPCSPYPTQFAHPLLSVSSHPKMAEFVVADDAGSVFLFDWANTGRAPVQLVDPRALADARTGARAGIGSAAWKPTDRDCVGATFGSRWVIWHLSHGGAGGGKPVLSGNGFLEGGHRLRWSPSDPNLFAISTLSPAQGATIQIFNTSFPGAAPSVVALDRRPNRVHDFDFLAGLGLAVAVGRRVHFVPLTQEVAAI